ncbi:hypothetical protein Bbelb_353040 [Branchiostoma belcheri]|nr:hypothetical protein Bbelb_353040 [Branchiostoma belcheri]
MSTFSGNVSSIDEERSAAGATNNADNVEPTNSCVSQPKTSTGHDTTKINDALATSEAIGENTTLVDELEDSTGDNSASGANENVSVPTLDASNLEDTDRETNINHSNTVASLDYTINPDSEDVDNEDHANVYENPNGILGKTSNDTDTPDPNNRVLTNPMYEADVSQPHPEDSNNDEHKQQDSSNTKSYRPTAANSKDEKNLKKTSIPTKHESTAAKSDVRTIQSQPVGRG